MNGTILLTKLRCIKGWSQGGRGGGQLSSILYTHGTHLSAKDQPSVRKYNFWFQRTVPRVYLMGDEHRRRWETIKIGGLLRDNLFMNLYSKCCFFRWFFSSLVCCFTGQDWANGRNAFVWENVLCNMYASCVSLPTKTNNSNCLKEKWAVTAVCLCIAVLLTN